MSSKTGFEAETLVARPTGGLDQETARDPTPTPDGPQDRVWRARLSRIPLDRYGTLIFFAIFIGALGISQGSAFISWTNISLVLANNAQLAFLAGAVTLTLIAGQFDLSVGALAGMSAMLTAVFLSKSGLSVPVTLILVLLAGATAGLINGLLVTKANVNAFIATLGTAGAFSGVQLWVSNGQTVFGGIPEGLTNAATHEVFSIPLPFIYVGILLLVLWAVTYRTVGGRFLYASGANAESARLAGVPVVKVTVLAFVGTGLVAAIGGIILVSRFGSADPSTGTDLLLPAFAAAFLGSSILSDGRFTVIGSILAAYLIAIATNGLDVAGVNFAAKPIFNGVVLVAAVALTEMLRRRRGMSSLVRAKKE